MAWYKIVTQHFLVVYYGISHLSLVFSSYTHDPKGSCVYRENTSDSWDIPYYYMDESVLLGTKPFVESVRHSIRDLSGVFSV